MPTTLQLSLSAVRQAADQVADVAGDLALRGVRLRLPVMTPATDATTIHLCRRTCQESRRLAYLLESAGDELARVAEGVLAYAHDAAALVRRTELGLMGLEIDVFNPSSEPSVRRSPRSAGTPTPPPEISNDLHAALSQTVLLSQGSDFGARPPVDVAHLRAAAVELRSGARTLRAAMSSGERPAAMLDRFAEWLAADVADAAAALNSSALQWAAAYGNAREDVQDCAELYRGWLTAVVTGGNHEPIDLVETAARARAVLRGYSAISIPEVGCPVHPQLGSSE
ncbi:hypothetical protein [Mycolicibacterium palauense]|uniref:hypothetical protein n=1 Tax=Mycolicibacterium palauense TaxID=2034511 RepID=UPI0011454F2A|nr:hypothetical protein [Mycolicibacterium palauense]